MILKTILIFLVTVLGYSEWALGTSYFQRPIVLGPLVGLIMGDLQAGIVMGATLELAMIGAVSIGAYNPPDLIAGTILGVSLAIQSGANASAHLHWVFLLQPYCWQQTQLLENHLDLYLFTDVTKMQRTEIIKLFQGICG